MMAGRRLPIKAFTPSTKNDISVCSPSESDTESTDRKSLWSPPPIVRNLMNKVSKVEERLNVLEDLIGCQTDSELKQREQEEVEQSRQELQEVRSKLKEAVDRLRDTKNALDSLHSQTALDRQKLSAQEAENKELQQLVQDLERKLNERIKKVGRLEKQVNDMQRSLNNTNNQLAVLQQQMMQMQNQMNNLARGGTAVPETGSGSLSSSQQKFTETVGMAELPSTARNQSHRHPTGALGLPPIAMQPQQNRNPHPHAMNFPPPHNGK